MGNKLKYFKEDLFWEATRRNEDYKNYYTEMANLNNSVYGRIIPPLASSRAYRWKLNWLCDPIQNIDSIKIMMANGEKPEDVHPYYHLNELNYKIVIELKTYADFKRHVEDNLILAVNIDANDDDIIAKIKDIKKNQREIIKKGILEQCNNVVNTKYNPTKIDNYIGWLRIYDNVCDYIKREYNNDKIKYNNGYMVIPDGALWNDFVDGNLDHIKFESQRRNITRAYNGAIQLITNSPNLDFSFSK